jgi:DNA-binding CsgD family transcriptional regulator
MISKAGNHLLATIRQEHEASERMLRRDSSHLGAATATAEPGGPAMLVVDGLGRLAGVTPAGHVMLDQLPPGTMGPVPDVINALAATVRSSLARGHGEVRTARVMVRGVWGTWLILEAAPLQGEPDGVAISLAPAARHDLAAVLLQAYGLTARETEVALGVRRHETSAQIAAALHLSRWTVQDHLKAVFAKTGVHSRADLALQLFASHTAVASTGRCPDDRRESGHRVEVALGGQLQPQLAQDRRLSDM